MKFWAWILTLIFFTCNNFCSRQAQADTETQKWVLLDGQVLIEVPISWEPASAAILNLQSEGAGYLDAALTHPDNMAGMSYSYRTENLDITNTKLVQRDLKRVMLERGWKIKWATPVQIGGKNFATVHCTRTIKGLYVENFLAATPVGEKLLVLHFMGAGRNSGPRLRQGERALSTVVFAENEAGLASKGFKILDLPKTMPGAGYSKMPAWKLAEITANTGESQGYATFPQTGVKLIQPLGFERAEKFDGFIQLNGQASLRLFNFRKYPSELITNYSAKNLLERGMVLLSKEDLHIEGMSGALIGVTEFKDTQQFYKWIVILGEKKSSLVVNAEFLNSESDEFSDMMKVVALSCRFDDPLAPPPE